ncbi:hypothetical protein TI04_10960, partial [Achromatium sp. WMS2]
TKPKQLERQHSTGSSKAVAQGPRGDKRQLVGHVLIVEDNPVNLAVVRKMLQRFGLTCDTAKDGLECLEAIKTMQYDLVLMDIQMPNMDGRQATRKIREREQQFGLTRMPVLAITANVMGDDRAKCIQAGMDDYIAKPVKPTDLNNLLQQWLPMQETVISQGRTAPRVASVVSSMGANNALANVEANTSEELLALDKNVLGELFDIMEDEAVRLLQDYINNVPEIFKNIDLAIREGAANNLVLPAHSLKSSSANVGATRVSALAKQLEFMAKENKMDAAAVCWQSMKIAYAQAERELIAIIKKGGL